ncbi:MAG: nitrophenyl compound nitroreductase subunit ArsF family protein [Nitrospirota bacterium]|nr:nitrophenyl compound nitroreductase subunit ArsF family protein [Nitrospirota bacterium]
MQKKTIIIIIAIAIIGTAFLILKNGNKSTEAQSQNNQIAENQSTEEKQSAEKIQVFAFHATQRCYSCITIGKFAGETVNEYFQPELRDGKIEFREINIDLPENKELARKFQASGSSLFINAISNGKDNIAEDTRVWRLISSEIQFKNYLKDKIDNLLGK